LLPIIAGRRVHVSAYAVAVRTDEFPIAPLLPDILAALAGQSRLVLEAPPGAGKTTQVPPALLDAPWLAGGRVVMLEPRRVAARAAAGFMAAQRGEAVGQTVGYRIRFESKVSAATRIEVVTEGILTRMIQDDPSLDGVGALVFDEFHERHLSADLGLALALDVQAQLRPDLRIVVMSATLDGERLARFLDAPRLSAEGRAYPVTVGHFASGRDEPAMAQLRRCVEHCLTTHPGDLLVFLPGQREIAHAERALSAALAQLTVAGSAASEAVRILPLHGELPVAAQSAALQPDPDGRRRVVLATNVAESSVTLPGVRVVIDSGLAREPRYDPNSGFSRLETVAISQASADQRAGRAGRVAEGWCYRLWPQSQRLEPARRPEIAQVELSALALELAGWGSEALRFPDPPPPGALAAGRDLLTRLGALDQDRPTALGRRMLALGSHPRLAAMLLAVDEPERALACDLAALIEARDPLRDISDDLAARWRALAAFRDNKAPPTARGALAAIDQAARQWRRRLRCADTPPASVPAHAVGDLLAHAFPDRVGHQHPGEPLRYALANGRTLRLFDDSALYGEPWIVATELRFEAGDARLTRGAPVDEARLRRDFSAHFVESDSVRWDADACALIARRERRFDAIVLDSRSAGRPDPALAAEALCRAVAERGLDALPFTPTLAQWRERVRCLRDWLPELALPDLADETLLATLDDWLKPALSGKHRLDALSESELAEALQSGIDWAVRRRIDALAPRRIEVPSGRAHAIVYQHGAAPVLAVKLQEVFGLAETPRIAEGRVPLQLHLLSPAGRPLAVTQDLSSFWQNVYPDVRKEGKGRYPKHPWPEDPWSATATHRAKPRSRA
jgi:ATP-dependent helicase HrpB